MTDFMADQAPCIWLIFRKAALISRPATVVQVQTEHVVIVLSGVSHYFILNLDIINQCHPINSNNPITLKYIPISCMYLECIYIYIYVCIYIYITIPIRHTRTYIYIYTHTHDILPR